MRLESIITSILIIISLIHKDMPDWLVIAIPSVITGLVVLLFLFKDVFINIVTGNNIEIERFILILVVSIPCIIAPEAVNADPDNALVALWLRIGGVLVRLLGTILLYMGVDKDCTVDFKNECFQGVLADLSLLGIIPAALDIYFGWMSIGSGISLFLTLVYSVYLIYEPKKSMWNYNLTNNEEQQRLFGSINDDDI